MIREKERTVANFSVVKSISYTWRDIGSSYLLSDLQAAYLWAQLEEADKINDRRLLLWKRYDEALQPLVDAGRLVLATVPEGLKHNAHMFYIKLKDIEERTEFNDYMKSHGILTVFLRCITH